METLKPFKMPAKAAPSALASFAKTLECRPVMLPTTEPLRGLEPKNLLAKLDGNAGNMGSSHNLSPLKPVGTSTLAAFAKSVVLEPGLQDKCLQDKSPSKPPGELKKRSSQLERIPKDKEQAMEGGGLEEKRERQTDKTVRPREEHSESKYENEVEERTHKELPSQERKYSQSSGSEIDMAEYACSDSEDEPTDAGTTSDHNSYNLLYDDDPIVPEPKVTRVPTIFLPKTTNDEVIYAISIRDNDYLAALLSTLSPTDLLLSRDADRRTVYHYAALSKSERIRRMVFNFVGVYFDIKASEDMSSLRLALQRVQHPRDGNLEWNPPRVKEVKSNYDKVKYDNYREVCSLEDAYGRSLLHYLAVNERWLLSDLNPALLKVLKSEKRILLTRDQCNRYPLQYSILHGNIKCIHFWFSLGISQELSKPDIDQWVALNSSAEVYSLLYRQLELHDAARYDDTKKTADSGEQSDSGSALLSAHLLSKTLSINKNTPTSKLRVPLHRAAIYGDTDAIEALLMSGTDPNSQDSDGWTALHFGAAATHSVIVFDLYK
ncbi:hypothetical protein Poli38472_002570 [Pythium oligandrum]|uniref:Uncharacterized protein n=1 Tax=Pythium oligandrum TaxID=41045 RepID=A0A8K1FJY4_PYTOL|nr:hypothetical protein Poli38472_002570 [Pythium oligandrum]|eukprot:TMW63629.1 hypothetical protein Poli38472_002570 [Pythium oligandrum]